MGIADNTENNILKLIFNATAWANYADNAASTPQTNVHCALHNADPGDSGNMSTSETTYTSYARVNVARTSGGWTVTTNSVAPVAAITFPASTGGSGSQGFFCIGTATSGTGKILYTGTVTPAISTTVGVTPILTT